ncbi:MAG: dephospho-CoA kinase [Chitinophagaceae bacterium]|nr:dephospho-CoA kinase [Chitinophagaceae bacterium]MCB9045830.1 dephospho-CoA kinase [Chitinophagales bacterium]
MLKVGITGGIGAGKSVVCRVFHTLGIPVFDADHAAKMLMDTDPTLIAGITKLLGPGVYTSGKVNREQLAAAVFKDKSLLQQLNALVHPATIDYGKKWMQQQNAPYTIKEAAIFFESGSYKDMDVMVGVTAPEELRISRAMQRSGMTREKVQERIASQMNDAEKMAMCDHVIINDDKQAIIPQVMQLHSQLLDRAKLR